MEGNPDGGDIFRSPLPQKCVHNSFNFLSPVAPSNFPAHEVGGNPLERGGSGGWCSAEVGLSQRLFLLLHLKSVRPPRTCINGWQ